MKEVLQGDLAKIKLAPDVEIIDVFGVGDNNVKTIEKSLDVQIFVRDGYINIIGGKASRGRKIVEELLQLVENNQKIDRQKIEYIISLAEDDKSYVMEKLDQNVICYTHVGKPLVPKTVGQKKYVEEIEKNDVVFGIGPAGTGKTYLAVAMAANMYKQKKVEKIMLARPAVEAGENLGFLPGDLQDKVDPYLRPLYDALYDIFGRETSSKLREKEIIEVVPLAYMRGRTLDKACIILDEAQNTTKEQMKMFLTRMGFYSKMIITGDITQIDLPRGKKSGLVEAMKVLKNIKEISFCHFKDVDVVRHQLVKKIIGAYDNYYKRQGERD